MGGSSNFYTVAAQGNESKGGVSQNYGSRGGDDGVQLCCYICCN